MVRVKNFDLELDSLLGAKEVNNLLWNGIFLIVLKCEDVIDKFGVLAEEESFGDGRTKYWTVWPVVCYAVVMVSIIFIVCTWVPVGQKVDASSPSGFELVDYNKIQKSTHLTFIFASIQFISQKSFHLNQAWIIWHFNEYWTINFFHGK